MAVRSVDLGGNRSRLRKEAPVKNLFFAAAVFSIVVSALIVLSLIREAWNFMSAVEWKTVWGDGWYPRRGEYDVKTLLVGSLLVSFIAMLVAVPMGLGAAVYLSEYAPARLRRALKPILETIAAVPSVVIGVFVLSFISPDIIQSIWDSTPQRTLFAAGIGVGILLIPLVASVTEDALRSVPNTLREASYGLGAKKITTVTRVVMPAALSGVVASLILAVSRALGETMIVFIAGGRSGGSLFSVDPFEPGLTMTAAMASVATGTDAVVGAGLAFPSLFFVGLVLFVMTFGLNILADRFVRRFRQTY